MPRPIKPRRLGRPYREVCYVPRMVEEGAAGGVGERLSADELEALRLADAEGMSQEEGAGLMGVSRATFGRIVASGRGKAARALTEGLPLVLGAAGGGSFGPPRSRGEGGRHRRGAPERSGRGHGRGARGGPRKGSMGMG